MLAWLEALPSSPGGENVSYVPDEPVEKRAVKAMTFRMSVQAQMSFQRQAGARLQGGLQLSPSYLPAPLEPGREQP